MIFALINEPYLQILRRRNTPRLEVMRLRLRPCKRVNRDVHLHEPSRGWRRMDTLGNDPMRLLSFFQFVQTVFVPVFSIQLSRLSLSASVDPVLGSVCR